MVTVSGNGTYTTATGTNPGGYLPTVTGTYEWVAVYSGDGNNSGANSPFGDEPETVTAAVPSLTTTPGGTVTLGSFTIGGVKYLDATGDGFSGDDTWGAGVTINLYRDTNGTAGLQVGSGGDTLVASTTTAADGTYSFTLNTAGTYFVQEGVPPGSIQTGGGPNGTAGNTYYTINASAGHVYSGNNFDDFQVPNCCPSGVTFLVNNVNVGSSLSGKTAQGATVSAVLPSTATGTFTLVVYTAPSPSFSDSNAYQQTIYQSATGSYATAPGHKLTVTIPSTYYQIDFICGPAIGQLEPNQNHNAYGPDSANILYHAQNRFISGDNGGTKAPNPMPTGTPATPPSAVMIASPPSTLTDSATLSGGMNPGGTITFYLLPPGSTASTPLSSAVYTDVVMVHGNGSYDTSTGTNPGGYVPTTTGTYQWVAIYSGDANNSTVTSPFGSEPETVNSVSPVGQGDFATIGFWHNKNGQAVINSFNGCSTATALGNWLATNFPNLFGNASNPYTGTSLAGLTNAQVASVYANLWTPSGVTKNTYVQAFAVALGMYADTSSLGYNSTAAKYGFKNVPGGGGSLTFNVGSNGAAFGVANGTTLAVTQILQAVNANFSPTTGLFYGGDQTKTSAANNVLNGINTTGDIALESYDSGASAVATGVVGSGFALAQGTLLVYVDNSLGNITTDEQARIDDAIANENAELNADGLTLVEVGADQAANANITITVADTTSIGGAAQGVLGVTEMDGSITLVSGWNWYTGADPSGIGSDQYDFETAVAHELGHSIGLGHSPDTSSVMYPLLATGQVRRDLSANDLTVIGDAENGPEPLMAAPVGTGLGRSAPQAAAGLMPTTARSAAPTATVAQATVVSPPILPAPAAANPTVTTPVPTVGSSLVEVAVGPLASSGSAQGLGGTANSSPVGMMAQPPAGALTTPVTTGFLAPRPARTARQPVVASPLASRRPGVVPALDRQLAEGLIPVPHRMSPVSDSILDELAADPALWPCRGWDASITIPVLPPDSPPGVASRTDAVVQPDVSRSPAAFSERLAVLGLVAGLWGGAAVANARKRRSGSPSLERKPLNLGPARG